MRERVEKEKEDERERGDRDRYRRKMSSERVREMLGEEMTPSPAKKTQNKQSRS